MSGFVQAALGVDRARYEMGKDIAQHAALEDKYAKAMSGGNRIVNINVQAQQQQAQQLQLPVNQQLPANQQAFFHNGYQQQPEWYGGFNGGQPQGIAGQYRQEYGAAQNLYPVQIPTYNNSQFGQQPQAVDNGAINQQLQSNTPQKVSLKRKNAKPGSLSLQMDSSLADELARQSRTFGAAQRMLQPDDPSSSISQSSPRIPSRGVVLPGGSAMAKDSLKPSEKLVAASRGPTPSHSRQPTPRNFDMLVPGNAFGRQHGSVDVGIPTNTVRFGDASTPGSRPPHQYNGSNLPESRTVHAETGRSIPLQGPQAGSRFPNSNADLTPRRVVNPTENQIKPQTPIQPVEINQAPFYQNEHSSKLPITNHTNSMDQRSSRISPKGNSAQISNTLEGTTLVSDSKDNVQGSDESNSPLGQFQTSVGNALRESFGWLKEKAGMQDKQAAPEDMGISQTPRENLVQRHQIGEFVRVSVDATELHDACKDISAVGWKLEMQVLPYKFGKVCDHDPFHSNIVEVDFGPAGKWWLPCQVLKSIQEAQTSNAAAVPTNSLPNSQAPKTSSNAESHVVPNHASSSYQGPPSLSHPATRMSPNYMTNANSNANDPMPAANAKQIPGPARTLNASSSLPPPAMEQDQPPLHATVARDTAQVVQMDKSEDKRGVVGMVLESVAGGFIAVQNLLPGGAASENGHIQVGDIINGVNGHMVRGKDVTQVAQMLRGPVGSWLKLNVIRLDPTVDSGAVSADMALKRKVDSNSQHENDSSGNPNDATHSPAPSSTAQLQPLGSSVVNNAAASQAQAASTVNPINNFSTQETFVLRAPLINECNVRGGEVTTTDPMFDTLEALRSIVERCTRRTEHVKLDTISEADFIDVWRASSEGGERVELEFKEYSPRVFAGIRRYFGLPPDQYIDCVSSARGPFRRLTAPSLGGKGLFYAPNSRVIFKAISHAEQRLLVNLLPSYYKHIEENPGTLLPQILSIIRVRLGGVLLRFMVTNNIFWTVDRVDKAWDLKGVINRRSNALRNQSPDITVSPGQPAPVLGDLNWVESRSILSLGEERKALFMAQLRKDIQWLRGWMLLDYSLLVGEHKVCTAPTNYTNQLNDHGNAFPSLLRQICLTLSSHSLQIGAGEYRMADLQEDLKYEARRPSVWTGGDAKRYHVGIIDITMEWTTSKAIRTGFLHAVRGTHISAQNPSVYSKRLEEFLDRMIQ